MHLVREIGRTASIILSLSLYVHAQSDDDYNQNLTLRFYQNGQKDSCDYQASSRALTFTTSSIPVVDHCFDFADLFTGNATQGFVNQTWNLGGGVWTDGQAGIRWQLENVDTYDPQGNYSDVLYRQYVASPLRDRYKPGNLADRRVTMYGGKRCSEKDPNSNETLLPWYGYSCWSESKGGCGTLPYSIASFRVLPGFSDTRPSDTCWIFSERGQSKGSYLSSHSTLVYLTSTCLLSYLLI